MQNDDASNQNPQQLLSIGNAAEQLGISIDTIRRWEKKGRITAYRSPGGHRYFKKDELANLFGKRYTRTKPKSVNDSANYYKNSPSVVVVSTEPIQQPPQSATPTPSAWPAHPHHAEPPPPLPITATTKAYPLVISQESTSTDDASLPEMLQPVKVEDKIKESTTANTYNNFQEESLPLTSTSPEVIPSVSNDAQNYLTPTVSEENTTQPIQSEQKEVTEEVVSITQPATVSQEKQDTVLSPEKKPTVKRNVEKQGLTSFQKFLIGALIAFLIIDVILLFVWQLNFNFVSPLP